MNELWIKWSIVSQYAQNDAIYYLLETESDFSGSVQLYFQYTLTPNDGLDSTLPPVERIESKTVSFRNGRASYIVEGYPIETYTGEPGKYQVSTLVYTSGNIQNSNRYIKAEVWPGQSLNSPAYEVTQENMPLSFVPMYDVNANPITASLHEGGRVVIPFRTNLPEEDVYFGLYHTSILSEGITIDEVSGMQRATTVWSIASTLVGSPDGILTLIAKAITGRLSWNDYTTTYHQHVYTYSSSVVEVEAILFSPYTIEGSPLMSKCGYVVLKGAKPFGGNTEVFLFGGGKGFGTTKIMLTQDPTFDVFWGVAPVQDSGDGRVTGYKFEFFASTDYTGSGEVEVELRVESMSGSFSKHLSAIVDFSDGYGSLTVNLDAPLSPTGLYGEISVLSVFLPDGYSRSQISPVGPQRVNGL